MGTAIVITSGKGGTGKSSFTVGVASCLAAMGKRVLCMDMDIGLRNLDLSLGMTDVALMDVTDVIQGRCSLDRAAVPHPKLETLYLLPAPVTLPKDPLSQAAMIGLIEDPLSQAAMIGLIGQVKEKFDFCFIDCPAGIGSGFELSICAADRAIVVAGTDPISIRAAQAAVRKLRGRKIPIHLAMNRITKQFLRRMNTNVDDAMDALGLPLIGIIPEDPKVMLSASRGTPIILLEKKGAARAYYNISRRILGEQVPPMRI